MISDTNKDFPNEKIWIYFRAAFKMKINEKLRACVMRTNTMLSEAYLGAYQTFMMLCAIWYHLYNLKNGKNNHERVLLLVKL